MIATMPVMWVWVTAVLVAGEATTVRAPNEAPAGHPTEEGTPSGGAAAAGATPQGQSPEGAADDAPAAAPQASPAPVVESTPTTTSTEAERGRPDTSAPGDPAHEDPSAHPGAPKFENVVTVRTATERTPPPELLYSGERAKPRKSAVMVLGYRFFAISDGLGREQPWHFGTLEFTPLRRFVRLNLLTEVGFEGGEAARRDRADFAIQQKLGLGVQYPHWVTPFVEFQGGGGLARIELFERNDLVFLYSLGVDGGAQWAMTKWLFLHAALGWVRPVFRFPEQALHYDRLTFKVGLGF